MEVCSFWLMLLSPLLAFLLLSLFFISWFASVHSPLFAFPGLPCVVRPLELCPPGLSLCLFPFFCFRLSSVNIPSSLVFFSPLFVFSLFSVIFLSFRKKPRLVRSLLWFFRFFLPSLPRPVRSSPPFCGLFSECPLFLPRK